MSYSSQIADLLAAQLTKFVTLHRHQLAGQAANLDFWLVEIRHSLAMIDGYRERFERMKAAQEAPRLRISSTDKGCDSDSPRSIRSWGRSSAGRF
jgi:hypothetical protein